MAEKLAQNAIDTHLKTVPDWTQDGDSIKRAFKLDSFAGAIMFAGAVGQYADAADHHPDILIQWRNVTLTLSTHSAGGLTEKDFALAQQIDGIPR